jgi:hypothetical protein
MRKYGQRKKADAENFEAAKKVQATAILDARLTSDQLRVTSHWSLVTSH